MYASMSSGELYEPNVSANVRAAKVASATESTGVALRICIWVMRSPTLSR